MFDIIPFRPEFQNQLINLILSIQQLEFNVPITAEDQPDLLIIDEFYRRNGGEFWIAVSEGKVIGSIALIKLDNGNGVIRKMFVAKEYRGKEYGVAQQLFAALSQYCKQASIQSVYLGTIDRLQAAIRFYEKNGFTQIEKQQLPADFPIMPVDNVFCQLNIPGKESH